MRHTEFQPHSGRHQQPAVAGQSMWRISWSGLSHQT